MSRGIDRIDALAALTGGFAHDVNNLLTVIRGSAEMLERSGLPRTDQQDHARAIVEAADRTARLTQQLLAFSRRQPLRPRAVGLGELLATLRDEIGVDAGPDIKVRILMPDNLRPVLVDPLALAATIRSAAENARDAMPEGGVLTFAAHNFDAAGAAQVRLSIADSGIGMHPDVAARAFEPFFTTKALGVGSGMGLAQVHGFAAQSGGHAAIESAPGRGTTLVLILPAAREVADAATPAAEPPAEGTRVLLVEDSNTVAAFAEALLSSMGCAVTRAACASEALDRLAEADGRFDIMFSDIVMPGMSGLDLAEQVRRDHPRLPILLATGHSEQVARGGSAFPVLPKPYRRDALAQMMGTAMAA